MVSEDLLDNFTLKATVYPTYTIHLSYARGVRAQTETRWERKEKIGEGEFGQVWRETYSALDGSQKDRAVKVIRKQRMNRFQIDFRKELLALAKFSKEEYRQANVMVSFLGWFENDESVFLAMEYFQHGDLARHIPSISTEDEVRQIATDLLEGLRIIHAEGFTHRDLKPQNILVAERPPKSTRWWVKIGDFGISKRIRNEETALRTQTGTLHFQAPEIQGFIDNDDNTSEYSNAVDIWSLGCIVYNISAHRVPFLKPVEVNKFCHDRLEFPRGPLNPVLSAVGVSFIERLMIPEPARRLTVECALTDAWILTAPSQSTLQNHHEAEFDQAKMNETRYHRQLAVANHGGMDIAYNPSYDLHILNNQADPTIQTTLTAANSAQETTALNVSRVSPDPSTTYAIHGEITPGTSRLAGTATGHPVLPDGSRLSLHWSSGSLRNPTERAQVTSHSMTTTISGPQSETDPNWQKCEELAGHTGYVSGVAFSPDGKLIASSSRDKTVRLWDVATGQTRYKLEGHTDYVTRVAFSPDGKLIASSSWDKTVRLWDVATGQTRYKLEGHTYYVSGVVFSPDGKLIASSSGDKTVRLWDVATGQTSYKLEGHTDYVYGVVFSPDGKLIASSSGDKTVRLWDVATGQTRYKLEGHTDYVTRVAFSPDGKLIASSSGDKTVRLWDVATGQTRYKLEGHTHYVSGVVFSPDGKLIASSSWDKTVRLWGAEVETKKKVGGNREEKPVKVKKKSWRKRFPLFIQR